RRAALAALASLAPRVALVPLVPLVPLVTLARRLAGLAGASLLPASRSQPGRPCAVRRLRLRRRRLACRAARRLGVGPRRLLAEFPEAGTWHQAELDATRLEVDPRYLDIDGIGQAVALARAL